MLHSLWCLCKDKPPTSKCIQMEHDTRGSRDQLTSSVSTEIDININEVEMPDASTQLTITSVLNFCKKRMLKPYLKLLSFMGLRPLFSEVHEPSVCVSTVNWFYVVLVITVLLTGYVFHYMTCFRRERGFCYKFPDDLYVLRSEAKEVYEEICHASIWFNFIIPSCLHLGAYIYTIFVIRKSDDDQLPILMERVFLSSTNLMNGYHYQKNLARKLWIFVGLSSLWMITSLGAVVFMTAKGIVYFRWLDKEPESTKLALKIVLVVSTLLHDMVQATIISNYCLQAELLTSQVKFLKEKLLQYPVRTLEWMRETEDFKKILKYFNKHIAASVCVFTIVNISYSISGILWLLKYDYVDRRTIPIFGLSALNTTLWILISIAPFVQAGRLTVACSMLKETGQEVRVRPLPHQDTPFYELDSVLLYTSSLDIKARLFYLPITGTYLCTLAVIALICVLVLGQCHYLNQFIP